MHGCRRALGSHPCVAYTPISSRYDVTCCNSRSYTLVENLGFVGSVGAPSMQLTMRLWHMLTMTSFAFFKSPRGR